MDKYYQILGKVLSSGKMQSNKKGNIRYLLNEQLTLLPADLLDIFEGHTIARKKLKKRVTTVYTHMEIFKNRLGSCSQGKPIVPPVDSGLPVFFHVSFAPHKQL